MWMEIEPRAGCPWLLCEGSRRENGEVGHRGCQTLELKLSSVVMGSLPRRLKQGVIKS